MDKVVVSGEISVKGAPLSCGDSRILEGYVSPYDATVVARLRQAGAEIVRSEELGVRGGAVALGWACPSETAADGSESHGVDLKPSYGRVSRSGVMPYASSMDQVRVIGKRVEDVAGLLQAISGGGPLDGASGG
ncbi:MAG: amidase family protein, partial [Kiritimatiellaeota bacterium]|nr:amidase family protein [Kiritimatiellota bacterium]